MRVSDSLEGKTLSVTGAASIGGYLSTPGRPAFTVYGAATNAANVVMTWQSKPLDIGNNFNIATGRFTAPVAGVYAFDASLLVQNSSADMWSFRKNGTKINSRQTYSTISNTVLQQIASAVLVSLAAGDYVDLFTNVSLFSGNDGLCTFTGFMVG